MSQPERRHKRGNTSTVMGNQRESLENIISVCYLCFPCLSFRRVEEFPFIVTKMLLGTPLDMKV
jgi:hypothetical protein